jgi:hypothetical protein
MNTLVTPQGIYRLYRFDTEKEFEECILSQIETIFGKKCVYLDCKRRIGKHGMKRSIPDGYLIDFKSSHAPKMFVVETEIASHDLFQHIGVQLLQFAHSFAGAPRQVKQMLFEEVSADGKVLQVCERHARQYGMRNVDNMLDHLVHDTFRALIIIDEDTEELHKVLNNFRFPVEVIEVATYKGKKGDFIYRFAPLFQDVAGVGESDENREQGLVDLSECDTVVVPAHEDGFQETFIGENRWYAIRIHASMISQIKYIAAYRVAPTSAITHWAQVKNVEPWENTGKFVVNFVESAREIGPIPLIPKGKVKAPQNLRYTSFDKLRKAKTLDEVFLK